MFRIRIDEGEKPWKRALHTRKPQPKMEYLTKDQVVLIKKTFPELKREHPVRCMYGLDRLYIDCLGDDNDKKRIVNRQIRAENKRHKHEQ